MQTTLVNAVIRRGISSFARMLSARKITDSGILQQASMVPITEGNTLVCWCSMARTRRGDELARAQALGRGRLAASVQILVVDENFATQTNAAISSG